jgi:hypothetical protein
MYPEIGPPGMVPKGGPRVFRRECSAKGSPQSMVAQVWSPSIFSKRVSKDFSRGGPPIVFPQR